MPSVVYADSSVLVAWFHAKDPVAPAVRAWMLRHDSPGLFYNPVHRLEARHNIRMMRGTRWGEIAWHALRAAEAGTSRLRGYRVDLLGLYQRAEQISAEHQGQIQCGSTDLIHIAGAMDREALFATCDHAQAKAARLVNLKCVLIGE